VYRGGDVPKPGDEPVSPNLSRGGMAPPEMQPVEIVVESFAFAP
jgi:hypothetical protein